MLPMMGTAWRRGTLAALAVAVVLAVAPAHADDAAEARQEYQQGSAAYEHKKFPEAATHFEAAAALKPNAIALITAGQAWELAQRPERAADAYGRALEMPGIEPKQGKIARERLSDLERSLGTVNVSAPDGWRVQLESYTEVPTPARLHGPPGPRVIAVRIPGKPLERREVVLEAGKTLHLELKDEPKPPKEPEPPPKVEPPPEPPRRVQEAFWTTPRVVGVGALAVGVGALASTAILGTSANDAERAFNAAPTRTSFDHASSLETWTNVTLIAGVVLVAAGVALCVVPFGERERSRSGLAHRLARGEL